MDTPLRVAVIGTGYLGSLHAKTYREIEGCQLQAVCDIDRNRLSAVSNALGVAGYDDYRQLLGKVDAASIAVPTQLHYAITKEFILRGTHCMVEKPFTVSLKEADSLIALSRKKSVLLQVGHIERFNSAFGATLKLIRQPKFIECHRLSPFPNRSLDVGVVLDIMIHDIDIVLGLVAQPVKKIEAVGVNVLTKFEDIANARLTFKNGCVANLTASRVSDEVMRKIRIFQKDTYISLDYKEARASVYKKVGPAIVKEDLPIEKEQPLKKELESFLDCVRFRRKPLVSGEVARDALAVALAIQRQIWKKRCI
ncbi:MAG: gfo/Idh/MocA family oxidoreductase [Candidatus Omnitrophota bacterium]|jgi:predicted dehydrogenase|nr:MAG: gfo/Idh/MocA family oxidoreductase [Candidatus Omnitrophota bacterium]